MGDKVMPIAIIGMGCRCPGDATNPENLWDLVSEARSAWSPVPKEMYNAEAFYHPNASRHGSAPVRGGHYLKEDKALFDAPFFNMTSAEAAVLDPQQRLLLETCYESIENAGIQLSKMAGSDTSCFIGSFCRDFTDVQLRDPETMPVYQATGGGPSLAFLSNRLSYYFDLKGPSVTVDTACSASLVALHLACQTIRTGESKVAIAGGSNSILSHEIMITMSMMGFFSPDGRCYSFDQRANGYGRGEGAACVVLKSLQDAIRDGDPIRGVIRNTGINQDGKTAGITLPSKDAQEALIRSVYRNAGLDPIHTGYVEAHGTGTSAGDPLEASALSQVFGPGRSVETPLRIGSIKSNLGHLEGASGLTGLIKTVLMLEKGLILPNHDFQNGNKRIPFEDWKLKVPTSVEPWNTSGVRRASINSFGYGGTNAHVIIDDAPTHLTSINLSHSLNGITRMNGATQNGPSKTNGSQDTLSKSRLYSLSSFDESSGKRYAKLLAAYVKCQHPSRENFLDDLSFTLNERRTKFSWKTAFFAKSADDLVKCLEDDSISMSRTSKQPILGFVFTGQGAQWYGMGQELIHHPVFHSSLSTSEMHLRKLGASWSLLEELQKDSESSRVGLAFLSQPICTAIQIALVDLLASWNIKPSSVVGHSSGEISAAYAAGALTLEDAIAVAYHRGKVTDKLANSEFKGAMMAVGMSKAEAEPIISNLKSGRVSVACENSPSSITISGDTSAIDEMLDILDQNKVFARKLAVEFAYHSHHMEFVANDYASALANLSPHQSGSVEFYSSVTGAKIELNELDSNYWVSNMVGRVKFSESLFTLCLGSSGGKRRRKRGGGSPAVDVLVELGPHGALSGPIKQILQSHEQLGRASITYVSALSRNTDAVKTTGELACELLKRGYPVNMSAVNLNENVSSNVLVDLPPYSWNHSNALWSESRISKAFRNRLHPRTDILGVEDINCNRLEPRWRNIIRPSEIPWVRDHKVQSQIVYPAAGFIAMAIEAANQQANLKSFDIDAYRLRDITIGQALIIPEDQPEIETSLSLRPYCESSRETSTIWNEFCIFSVTEDNTWTEHCRGLITVDLKSAPSEVDGAALESRDLGNFVDLNAMASEEVETKDFYGTLASLGLEYGPTFSNMTKYQAIAGRCLAKVVISDTASSMPMSFQYPVVVHPSTLDACLHPLFPAISAANGSLEPMVPTFLEAMSVSARISSEPGHEFSVTAKSEKTNFRQHRVSLTACNQTCGSQEPMINITGLTCTTLARETNADSTDEAPRKLCFQMDWRPDINLLTAKHAESLCEHPPPFGEEARIESLEQVGFYLMDRALKTVANEEASSFLQHHKKLWRCMKSFCKRVKSNEMDVSTTSWVEADEAQRADVIAKVRSSGAEGDLLCHVGDNLPSILRHEVEPLAVMMENDRLDNYYAQNSRMGLNYKQAATYIDLLAHKNPHLKILEIGAGTGGATLPILEALGGSDASLSRFVSYDFTDISSGFFENAKERFNQWGSLLNFKKLNIEEDPINQGYEDGTYDLVIAANVLHATESMDKTMRNVRKMIKPGGKLCLIELTRERFMTSTVFGTLLGWWAGQEKSRQKGPTLTEVEWDHLLKQTGFSGLDASVWDMPTEFHHQGSMIISNAPTEVPATYPDVTIIADESVPEPFSAGLISSLETLGVKKIELSNLNDVTPNGKTFIVLGGMAQTILKNPTEDEFLSVKNILLRARAVLWVVNGAVIECKDPTANLITGLSRTLRSENGSNITTLDLESLDSATATSSITKVFEANFNQNQSEDIEVEYAERNAQILIPRVVEDDVMNTNVRAANKLPGPTDQPFSQDGYPIAMEIRTPGLLDTLSFVPDARMESRLPANCVEILIKASGVNFRDVMIAMGQINIDKLGIECSGVITAVGKDVQGLAVDDRVVTYGCGTFGNYLRQEASAVQLVPDDMSFEAATTLPIVYCTAYHAVYKAAQLEHGETVLIHSASGGLGQALIMMCQMIGAEVFATVGTVEKEKFLIDTYSIPEDHVFPSHKIAFAQSLMTKTGGKGVDVVMNSVAGEALRVTWNCIAPFGRFIELGKRDFIRNTRLDMSPFARNVTFAAVDFIHLSKKKPAQTAKMWAEVMNLIRKGSIKPPTPIKTLRFSEAEKAFRIMQAGKHIGKLVLVAEPDEIVQAIPRDLSHKLFHSDASYLLVGGLGGIGRAIATWMVKHGAKNLVFASRSGLAKQSAKDVVKLLRSQGANVSVFDCDIGSEEQVQDVIRKAEQDLPLICGVFQGAMVLKDNLFQNMTIDEYNNSVRPKVQGTWNLHNALAKNKLDFFIMLSSTSGIIGNSSQAQYAAASTFLDAFADYRNSLGLPAVTLDLGVVADIGYVAENEHIRSGLKKLRFDSIQEPELMAMIKSAILEPFRGERSGQTITGLGTWQPDGSQAAFSYPMFSHFRRMALKSEEGEERSGNAIGNARELLRLASSMSQAAEIACMGITNKMSSLLMINVDEIQTSRPMSDYGVDSLVAVEMRSWLFREMDVVISVFELLANVPLRRLSADIVKKSKVVDPEILKCSD